MKRHLQFLAVLTALAVPCAAAQAQTLDAKIASVTKAANDFVALAKDSAKTGKPPRQTDAAAKPLLDTVFNTKDIEGNNPLPWSEIKALEQWNVALTKVGLVYYLAGTGAPELSGIGGNPEALTKATQNTVDFAPEYGRYSDAQIRVHSALLSTALARTAAATPEDTKDTALRDTLTSISDAVAEVMTGVLGGMALQGMDDAWLLSRAAVLLEITPKAAKFLTPGDRQRVKSAAVAVGDQMKNPDVRSGVYAVARGLELLATGGG